jgi:penicillin-binding protein 1C
MGEPVTVVARGDRLAGRLVGRRLVHWMLLTVTAVNAGLLVIAALAVVIPLPARGGDWSVAVEYRGGRPAYVFLSRDDEWRLPVALDDVDPRFVAALVARTSGSSATRSRSDRGRAAITDVLHARRVSGAHADDAAGAAAEPRPRTLANKLVDMFRAVHADPAGQARDPEQHHRARRTQRRGRRVGGVVVLRHGART